MPRDELSRSTKEALAKRVGMRCSNPACKYPTSGPHSASDQFVNLGVACHITAAAPGGPRYEATLTSLQRSSIENAIWLCQSCAKLVDSDTQKYSVSALVTWRLNAEAEAGLALLSRDPDRFYPQPLAAKHVPIPRIQGLAYHNARNLLIAAGWQPFRNNWSYATEMGITSGNGLHFWEEGFHEIENSSGTGLSHCSFVFYDQYGAKLRVVTAGEVIPELKAEAIVWSWRVNEPDL